MRRVSWPYSDARKTIEANANKPSKSIINYTLAISICFLYGVLLNELLDLRKVDTVFVF